MKTCITTIVILCLSLGCTGPRADGASTSPSRSPTPLFDPVVADPPRFDAIDPPSLSETQFTIDAARLNGIVYEAQGAGPHPTVLLLHGFPGNEKNLDIAQALRRGGWNVVFFHYRGAWGSEGRFSFEHVLEDVAGVVEAIGQREFAVEHRIDPTRLALVGHSMGGFAALISGAELSEVDCVGSIAGANLGVVARGILADSAETEQVATLLDSWAGPIQGASGEELAAELVANLERFDTLRAAPLLAEKPLLLIAGELDRVTPPSLNHLPLVEALEHEGAASLDAVVIPRADHSFSGQRIELTRRVIGWLEKSCTKPASPDP
jgi:pimeloyl-ACP methyl ester carboxylesterase